MSVHEKEVPFMICRFSLERITFLKISQNPRVPLSRQNGKNVKLAQTSDLKTSCLKTTNERAILLSSTNGM